MREEEIDDEGKHWMRNIHQWMGETHDGPSHRDSEEMVNLTLNDHSHIVNVFSIMMMIVKCRG